MKAATPKQETKAQPTGSPEQQEAVEVPPQVSIPGHTPVKRFSRLNRVLHILMIVSFVSLALTGMTLKFSYTGWASFLARVFGGYESAGYIHRVAALLMFGIFFTHLYDLAKKKKQEFGTWRALLTGEDTMLFTRRDFREFIGSVKWFFHQGPRPQFGRWTYWEKFDYFAVFWGVFIIGSTGLMLWFPEVFTLVVPGWFINVATIIHSDEALLAVGFIFTVHFFNTHLRPEKFPMDVVIFTGYQTAQELEEDRPREYEQLRKDGKLKDLTVEQYQPVVIKAIKIFGWTALGLGFSIILLIIYAMVFAYR